MMTPESQQSAGEKLLPCPFCGTKAELVGGPEWWVRCTFIGVCIGNSPGGCMHKEDAIELWNKRSSVGTGVAVEAENKEVLGEKEADVNAEIPTGQKKVIGGIVIPEGPPPTLVEAAQDALVVLGVFVVTDKVHGYKEINSDFRKSIYDAFGKLFEALEGTASVQKGNDKL